MSILSDAIKENISILDYAATAGFTVIPHGNEGFKLKGVAVNGSDFSSVHINASGTMFFRYSTQTGGSVIDFAMMVDNLDKSDAIKRLRSMLPNGKSIDKSNEPRARPANISQPPKPPPKELQLPPVSTEKFKHIYSYLINSRKISKNIITDLVQRKQLYEDAVNHNAIWVGYDYDGKPGFACRRITYDKPSKEGGFVKGDVVGSKKSVGMMIDNHSSTLFLCEAPIDAMSLMTLLELHKLDFRKYSYLAQGGVYLGAVKYHLEHQPGINKIYLCYDNDDAGHKARGDAKALLKEIGFKGQVIDKPPHSNDWNDDLKAISKTITQEQQQTKETNLQPKQNFNILER